MISPSNFYGKSSRFTTLDEVQWHSEIENSRNIVILPPEAGNNAIDSDVEDLPDQLDDDTAFEPAGELEVEGDSDSDTDIEADPVKNVKKGAYSWKKKSVFDTEIAHEENFMLADKFPELLLFSPLDLWKLFIPDSLIDEIVVQTKLYGNREKNKPDFNVTRSEIFRFIGILLLSGYHSLPKEQDYWSTQIDLGVPIVSSALSSKKFLEIKRMFHIIDNSTLSEASSKVAKIEPLYETLNRAFTKYGVFHRLLSVDESMVPYYGRHSCKMFIRNKPIRFGYKLWALCGNDGFPYHVQIYTGKSEDKSPLGQRVVQTMVDVVKTASKPERHELYCDNFFTSYELLCNLADQKMKAIGTVRENRLKGANRAMKTKKDMKKTNRGSFDYRCDGKVFVCQWNDNSIVNIASNFCTHEPIQNAKRRVKKCSDTSVPQPYLVKKYNEGMGGVDIMDRLLSSYRPMIRGKKWYFPLITNAFNMAVVAAWRLHCAVQSKKLSHIDFRREITICLLKMDNRDNNRRKSAVANLPQDIRTDGVGHKKVSVKQGRCKVCTKNTCYMCEKCNVRLHVERGKTCFETYHSNSM